MKYRLNVYKYLDVPKSIGQELMTGSEQEAIDRAKSMLVESEGDVVVVSVVTNGETRVIHRFEKVKKAS